ncbi:MAG TPA: MBG domain-containing protein, partial [Gemmatimonadaceae bacterium]|nr:MBG domain-containing protein [Gemmatimonadaceae bacterium]
NVGSYAIGQGSVALNANYALTYVAADLTVTARPVAVTADPASKTYGDADPTPLSYKITAGNLVNSDAFAGSLSRAPGENVGTYDILQGTLALSTNYALTYDKNTFTVNQRPIEITADAQTKVYGDADPTLTYKTTSGNLVNGDAFSGVLTRNPGENVGTYGILKGTVTAGGNYALSYAGANLSITARPVTVTADAQSKVYGDAEPSLTYKITAGNLVGTDAFSGALSTVTGAAATFGTHPIAQNTLALSTNYALTYVGANLTVAARPITVTADAQTKTYGDPDPPLTYKITSGNLVYGDVLSGDLSRVAGTNVGNYAIQQGNLSATTNYALTYSGASLAITPRSITLKPVAPDLTWTGAPQTPQYSLAIAGGSLGNGDMLSVFIGAIYSPMSVTLVGTYTPTLSGAANGNYAVSYATGTFKVIDATAPTGSIIALDPVGLGMKPTLVVNFTDVATGNSNIIAWKYSLDGVDQPVLSGSGTPSNTFTQQLSAFNTTDVVKVCASAEDAGTNWSTPVCALLAIYDPTAGFVTGGGWINSPFGAYAANPSLTGKANFGFVSKYQKGATVPTGNTEFQFNEANLNFSSTNFQWLVIQGGTSAQFKGTGTINGKGSYNFMVTVVDGDAYNGTKKPDSFRMKITDPATSAVVYDNQIGTPDTSLTPSQSTYLGGGSVVIHDK